MQRYMRTTSTENSSHQLITLLPQKCTKTNANTADLQMVDRGIPYFPLANSPLKYGQ